MSAEPRDLADPHDAIGGRPTRRNSALRWPRAPAQREDDVLADRCIVAAMRAAAELALRAEAEPDRRVASASVRLVARRLGSLASAVSLCRLPPTP